MLHSSTPVSLLLFLFPPLPAFLRSRSILLLPLPPRPSFPWTPPYGECAALPTQSCLSISWHLTMNRSAASRTPRYHFSAIFCCSGRQRGTNTKYQGGKNPLPLQWLRRNFLRSSTMHLCQVTNWTPGLGFLPANCHRMLDRVIASCFAVSRTPQRSAAVYRWSVRRSRNVSS